MGDTFFNFFGRKKEGRELSNFWQAPVDLTIADGDESGKARLYSCGEAAFHGSKYLTLYQEIKEDTARKRQLGEYAEKFELRGEFGHLAPNEIKKKGGKRGLRMTPEEIKIWNLKRLEVQKQICKYKFENDEKVRECLKATGQKILIHPAMRVRESNLHKCYWEGRAVKNERGEIEVKGRNMLGKIWMGMRC